MVGFGALLLFNVLLIDVKGIHMNSGIDLHDYNGISYVENEVIRAQRGRIFDANEYVLAQDADAWDVVAYISPDRPGNNLGIYYVDDPEGTAVALAEVLKADKDELYYLLTSDAFMTYLGPKARGIDADTKAAIEALDLNGIEFEKVKARYYPYSPYASHLIGFASYTYADDQGIDDLMGKTGIEVALDKYLTGVPGSQSYYRDTTGYSIVGQQVDYVAAKNGNDVYLTLDHRIQQQLQACLQESMDNSWSGTNAWGMVMEAKTGRILAYDNLPTYNQNLMDIDDYIDYNSMVSYEAGSVMKTFTYAAAIDHGGLNPDDTFDSSNFMVGYDSNGNIVRLYNSWASNYTGTIANFRGWTYGNVNYWYGFAASLNTGVATLLEKYVDNATYKKYMEDFGFFKTVDVFGIPNEAEGVENMNWPIEYVTTSYGQGSAFTALQIVQGYSAFCNGGQMVKPRIVDKIVDSSTGEVVYQSQTEYVGQPIKAESAETVLKLMDHAANTDYNGSASQYGLPDLRVGVKTGTAEVVNQYGQYGDTSIHSAVVVMPSDDPEIIIYVAYKDNDAYYAHNLAAWNKLERTCGEIYGMFNRSTNPDGQKEEGKSRTVYRDAMPALVNHTAEFANKKLEPYGLNIIRIGSGNQVLSQYPQAGSTLISGQRVMLLMGAGGYTMPNMKGWSRKEVTAFWELTGIEITLDGSGYVTEQNVAEGEPINMTTQIVVKME